jgi:hypothetical protein
MPKKLEDFEKLVCSENYHTWAFAMSNYLDLKGYSGCIIESVTETQKVALKNSYEEKGLPKRIGLLRSLLTLRLKDSMQIYTDSVLGF